MLSRRASLILTLCATWGGSAVPIAAGRVVAAPGRSVAVPQAAQPSTRPWVRMHVRVNGVTLDVREATVAVEHSALSARLSALWRVGEPGGAVQSLPPRHGGATVIGRQRDERHEVIRLQSMTSGLTRILVSSIDLSRAAARVPDPPFPPIDGTKVLSVIEMDGPQRATTFILQGPREASSAVTVWADRLRAAGWTALRAYDGRRSGAGGGQVQWARRGAEQLEAAVLRHGVGTRWVVRVSRHAG
jgi:hypothetical protein